MLAELSDLLKVDGCNKRQSKDALEVPHELACKANAARRKRGEMTPPDPRKRPLAVMGYWLIPSPIFRALFGTIGEQVIRDPKKKLESGSNIQRRSSLVGNLLELLHITTTLLTSGITANTRQGLTDRFNDTKPGTQQIWLPTMFHPTEGTNLHKASHNSYHLDQSPSDAQDTQNMRRIYRLGHKKDCTVVRFHLQHPLDFEHLRHNSRKAFLEVIAELDWRIFGKGEDGTDENERQDGLPDPHDHGSSGIDLFEWTVKNCKLALISDFCDEGHHSEFKPDELIMIIMQATKGGIVLWNPNTETVPTDQDSMETVHLLPVKRPSSDHGLLARDKRLSNGHEMVITRNIFVPVNRRTERPLAGSVVSRTKAFVEP